MAIGFNNPSLSVSFAMNDTASLKSRVMDFSPAEPGLSTPTSDFGIGAPSVK